MSQISDYLLSLLPLPPGTMPWQMQGPASRPFIPELYSPGHKVIYISWDDVIAVTHNQEGRKLKWRGPCDPDQIPRTQILAWTLVREEGTFIKSAFKDFCATQNQVKNLAQKELSKTYNPETIAKNIVDKALAASLEKLAEKVWDTFIKENEGLLHRSGPPFTGGILKTNITNSPTQPPAFELKTGQTLWLMKTGEHNIKGKTPPSDYGAKNAKEIKKFKKVAQASRKRAL